MPAAAASNPHPARALARGLRAACRCIVLVGAGFGAASAQAAGSDDAVAPPPRATLEVLNVPAAHAVAGAQPGAVGEATVEARFWWRAGALNLGAGADWGTGPGLQASRSVLGLRADIGARSRIAYEWLPATAGSGARADAAGQASESRVAFELDAGNRAMRSGFLRIQMSSHSTLALRPRGGGLVLALRSNF